jgi:hypothetical protein
MTPEQAQKNIDEYAAKLERQLSEMRTRLQEEQIRRVNHFADVERIVAWIRDPKRAPANSAFTEGPERQVAYAIEEKLCNKN